MATLTGDLQEQLHGTVSASKGTRVGHSRLPEELQDAHGAAGPRQLQSVSALGPQDLWYNLWGSRLQQSPPGGNTLPVAVVQLSDCKTLCEHAKLCVSSGAVKSPPLIAVPYLDSLDASGISKGQISSRFLSFEATDGELLAFAPWSMHVPDACCPGGLPH